jgi:PKD repeat protein
MPRALVPLIASAILLAFAPAAGAKEWCVPPASGCADGNIGILQSGLNLARMNPGPDSVRLGASTYAPVSGSFTYSDDGSATNSVAVVGAGSEATTLTRSSTGAIFSITSSGGARNSLTDLRFHITSSGSTGLSGGDADALRVGVAGDPAINSSAGLSIASGSARNVNVAMPLGGSNQGVVVSSNSGAATDGVFDSTISADIGATVFGAAVQRSYITGGHNAILTTSGKIDDVLLFVSGANPGGAGLEASNGSGLSGAAVARHLTILGNSSTGSVGIRVLANGGLSGATQALDVRSTIILGVEHSYVRTGTSFQHTGTANLTMHYTDYDPATRDDSGPGTGPDPADPTNPNTDPLFVDLSHFDYRLSGVSPLVDAGDPAALAADEPATDFAGGPRVVNGRTDIGAHEYQRRPPAITSATATPSAAQVGTPFTFTAAATDPDADSFTYAWSFDDGGSAPGASVQHAFTAAGLHMATVTVTDAAGASSMKTVAVAVDSNPVAVISALKLAPSKFRAAKGTGIAFTLSVAAPVRFTVDRASAGRNVKGRCRRPTKKNRHARSCTRYVAATGSFTRNGVAGANQFHWNGRLNGKALKPGSYRLTSTVGTGLASNFQRASFKVKR